MGFGPVMMNLQKPNLDRQPGCSEALETGVKGCAVVVGENVRELI